jgi:hypothetical protein
MNGWDQRYDFYKNSFAENIRDKITAVYAEKNGRNICYFYEKRHFSQKIGENCPK